MLRATATALFEGSQDPKAPITNGRVNPRQLYFSIFLAWPASMDSGASKVMVRSIIVGGSVEEMTMSGLRVEPGKTLLTDGAWPALVMVFTISASTRSCRRPMAGRLLRQWLVTCEVVSASILHLLHLVLGAEQPGFPKSGSRPRRLLWMRFHSLNERQVR